MSSGGGSPAPDCRKDVRAVNSYRGCCPWALSRAPVTRGLCSQPGRVVCRGLGWVAELPAVWGRKGVCLGWAGSRGLQPEAESTGHHILRPA